MKQYKQSVYNLLQKIPRGKVTTYGSIAKHLNIPSPRIVGKLLHENANPELIPCHRAVFSNGALSSSYAFGGYKEQKRKLEQEGISFKYKKVVLEKHLIRFFD